MHEGILSLMQMAKVSAALARYHEAGGLFISVLTNPTMGGVAASFASLGDLVFAEPKALIGFAGPRTIKATIRIELPKGFQTSEFLLEHGFIDRIVRRGRPEKRNRPRDRLLRQVASLAPAPRPGLCHRPGAPYLCALFCRLQCRHDNRHIESRQDVGRPAIGRIRQATLCRRRGQHPHLAYASRTTADYAAIVAEHIAAGNGRSWTTPFGPSFPSAPPAAAARCIPSAPMPSTTARWAKASRAWPITCFNVNNICDPKPAALRAPSLTTRGIAPANSPNCAAEIMVANGFEVFFFDDIRPTPELSFAVRDLRCACGIMISASHNPPSDNAIKAVLVHRRSIEAAARRRRPSVASRR